MSNASDLDNASSAVVDLAVRVPDNPLATPSSEGFFSQFVVDSPYQYPDISFSDEMTLSTSEAGHTGIYYHPSTHGT